jgi:thiamine biosynthesis protein ThiS
LEGNVLVKIGGSESQMPDASSIQEMLKLKNITGNSLIGLIVVVNGNVIRKEQWGMPLNPNDNVEIIRMVFGG